MVRTGRVWDQLLISVEPEAQDPAHEVQVEWAAGGQVCPEEKVGYIFRGYPANPCKPARGEVFGNGSQGTEYAM